MFFLLDSEEDPLSPCPAGLAKLALIDRDQLVDLPAIDVACDVDNPVLGPNGATAIFGPQKGANKIEQEALEAFLHSSRQSHQSHRPFRSCPGPGQPADSVSA